MTNDDLSNKDYLRGRAEVLRGTIAYLDERLNKGAGTWAHELRQRLEFALNGTEKILNRVESKEEIV